MGNFHYEDRIIWDELAPSLQALFKNAVEVSDKLEYVVDNLIQLGDSEITNNLLQLGDSSVTNNLMNVSNHNTEITNLINKSGDIISVTNVFTGDGGGGGGSSSTTLTNIQNTMTNLNDVLKIFGGGDGKSISDSWTAEPGKIAKTNSVGTLICDDLVYNIRAAGDSAGVNTLKGIPISLKDIFESWNRISCDAIGYTAVAKNRQNLLTSAHITARSAYSYDDNKKTIFAVRNSDPWTAFLSNSLYDPNFKIRYALDNTQLPSVEYADDDDGLFFICGYMVDSNGVFHTLQILRTGDQESSGNGTTATSHGVRFALVYDQYSAWPGTSNIGVLAQCPWNTIPKTNWNKNYTLVEVEKSYNETTGAAKIVARTGNPVSAANKSSATLTHSFTWTMPTSKPASWTQEMYDNIKKMMTSQSKIGFGTQSNCCGFLIDQANTVNIMDKLEIYDLASGVIRTYDKNGNEISSKSIGDAIKPNSLVYSSYIKRLYYYRKDNNFVELFTGGS